MSCSGDNCAKYGTKWVTYLQQRVATLQGDVKWDTATIKRLTESVQRYTSLAVQRLDQVGLATSEIDRLRRTCGARHDIILDLERDLKFERFEHQNTGKSLILADEQLEVLELKLKQSEDTIAALGEHYRQMGQEF